MGLPQASVHHFHSLLCTPLFFCFCTGVLEFCSFWRRSRLSLLHTALRHSSSLDVHRFVIAHPGCVHRYARLSVIYCFRGTVTPSIVGSYFSGLAQTALTSSPLCRFSFVVFLSSFYVDGAFSGFAFFPFSRVDMRESWL